MRRIQLELVCNKLDDPEQNILTISIYSLVFFTLFFICYSTFLLHTFSDIFIWSCDFCIWDWA